MSQATRYLRPHFNAYHHNNSLLFQFILSEFLIAQSELRAIDLHVGDLKLAVKEHPKSIHAHEKSISSIIANLTLLAGSSHEYMRIFSWNLDNGILAKLKNYCDFIAQNCDETDKDMQSLERYAHRAWMVCLQLLDASRQLHQLAPSNATLSKVLKTKTEDHMAALFDLHSKLNRAIKQLARTITRVIPQFRDDENVMFFVLNHQDQFDMAYGRLFCAKLFKNMYAKGLQEASHLMHTKYAKRGFQQLLPVITKKISLLQASLP